MKDFNGSAGLSAGANGMKRPIESVSRSLFWLASRRIAPAVNSLVIEPIQNALDVSSFIPREP